MNKLKINLKDYKEIIIIILTFIQVVIMFYYFKIKNQVQEPKYSNYTEPVNLTFNEINESINKSKGIELLEMEDLGNKWYLKINISGNIEKVKETIRELEEFEIYNYDISGKKDILSVILELHG